MAWQSTAFVHAALQLSRNSMSLYIAVVDSLFLSPISTKNGSVKRFSSYSGFLRALMHEPSMHLETWISLPVPSHSVSSGLCFSSFYSNLWLTFGKLWEAWEARSRLYRSQIWKWILVWKPLTRSTRFTRFCIFGIQYLLRSAFKNSAKSRQTFSD